MQSDKKSDEEVDSNPYSSQWSKDEIECLIARFARADEEEFKFNMIKKPTTPSL